MLSESDDQKYKYFVNIGIFFLKNEGMWLSNVWFSKTVMISIKQCDFSIIDTIIYFYIFHFNFC